ncbi:hypothetical protein llap_4464 [Limosa lapponica baueri]|uniref:Uncharacterized protein n=1 Tax=Limosa lapponica baueri TaxID=1758121 RepID=A0A2I0UGQ8_LIMLA|nr:hypothetical protein llap_4464 [Limosa lapponica baueri]
MKSCTWSVPALDYGLTELQPSLPFKRNFVILRVFLEVDEQLCEDYNMGSQHVVLTANPREIGKQQANRDVGPCKVPVESLQQRNAGKQRWVPDQDCQDVSAAENILTYTLSPFSLGEDVKGGQKLQFAKFPIT